MTHQTIKSVTEDIEKIRFNTMIASLMEFTNYLDDVRTKGSVSEASLENRDGYPDAADCSHCSPYGRRALDADRTQLQHSQSEMACLERRTGPGRAGHPGNPGQRQTARPLPGLGLHYRGRS